MPLADDHLHARRTAAAAERQPAAGKAAAAPGRGRRRRAGRRRVSRADGSVRSPDGRSVAFIRDGNIFIRPRRPPPRPAVALSTSGTTGGRSRPRRSSGRPTRRRSPPRASSSPAIAAWSATSSRRRPIRCSRRRSSASTPSPATRWIAQERVLLDVAGTAADHDRPGAVPESVRRCRRWCGGRTAARFTFEYNQRGHQAATA